MFQSDVATWISPAVMASGQLASRALDFTGSNSNASVIQSGQTWFFQYWYRDPLVAAPPDNFNLSNGMEVFFGL